MNEGTRVSDRKARIYLTAIIGIIIASLLALEYAGLLISTRAQAYQTTNVLIDQVKNVLTTNEKKEQALIDSLKDEYIAKAKAVSYIIDKNPRTETDIAELIRIATLLSIDEIHIFDESGMIYSGTVPPYYGFTFDSGEQIAFFKPMLSNKALSMCQDVTPNTAEGKSMMYAICWNDRGERMIQVGIEPRRLIEELRANEISEVVSGMPAYDGVEILVADKESNRILGATNTRRIDVKLTEMGLDLRGADLSEVYDFETVIGRKSAYCSASELDGYVIVIAQERAVANKNTPLVMLTVSAYLLLAAAVIVFIVRRMTRRLLEEQRNANTDAMTGFFNRRAYENDMTAQGGAPYEQNLVYVSADLNGLKGVNDAYGHKAGDELIAGAAQCLRQSLGNYGKLYRVGGDEFAALIFCDSAQMGRIERDVGQVAAEWSDRHEHKLAIACGFVRAEEFPNEPIFELAKKADTRMYEAKAEYYRKNGIDRRRYDRAEEKKQ